VIYREAYLNPGNLFPGAGAINRVIGLSADDIHKLGAEASGSHESAAPEWITGICEQVAYKVSEVSDQMDREGERLSRLSPQVAATFLEGFEEFFDTVTDYLINIEAHFLEVASHGVPKSVVGGALIDIAANFGFDLPHETLARPDMEALLQTEEALAGYEPGHPERLAAVLGRFMQIKRTLG
jgi:hypothetical protein